MASVFSAREAWTLPGDGGEDVFDGNSMCVIRIPSLRSECIVTGSFGGKLSIYNPSQDGYSSKDDILAAQLNFPILAVAAGPFVVSSEVPTRGVTAEFAVLHPQALVLYAVNVTLASQPARSDEDGGDIPADPYVQQTIDVADLKVVQSLPMEARSSTINFAFGKFRGSEQQDSFCVQSMNGALTFIEDGRTSFERYLPECLLPGPLCFVESTSSFVTCTVACHIEAYKYSNLVSASNHGKDNVDVVDDDEDESDSGDGKTKRVGKRVKADWSLCIGEHALDIKYVTTDNPLIMVLGERTLFWIDDSGVIFATKRFEMNPSCFCPYRTEGSDIDVLIGTHTNQLIVMRNTQVMWTALLDCVPIALGVGEFAGVRGMITALEDTGRLGCYYLGTDPNMPVQDGHDAREVDYEAMDTEMKELQGIIRDNAWGDNAKKTSVALDFEHTSLKVINKRGGNTRVEFKIVIQCNGDVDLGDVMIQLVCKHPVQAETDTYVIRISGGDPADIDVVLTCGKGIVYSTSLSITVSYSLQGEPRVSMYEIDLPMTMFCVAIVGGKPETDTFPVQFTVGIVDKVASLHDIFSGLFPHIDDLAVWIGFSLCDGTTASIHSPQGSGAFKVMGGDLASTWLLSKCLVQLIHRHLRGAKVEFRVTSAQSGSGPLAPLNLRDYYGILDAHFEDRLALQSAVEELDLMAKQMRVVQIRLLLRFQDKNPAPLEHLDGLMNSSYEKLLDVSEQANALSLELKMSASRLSAATQGLLLICRILFKLNTEQFAILENALSPQTVHETDQGWEERVDCAILMLLKKSSEGLASHDENTTLTFAPPKNTQKLRHHIDRLLKRMEAGVQLKF